MKLRLLYILSSCAGIAAGSAPAWALDGAALYKTHCSACHEAGDQRAPARSVLKQLSPQQIITALEKGAMIAQGAERSRAERRVLAEYLSGKPSR
jgi:mono/diheme cytochrome c family protein